MKLKPTAIIWPRTLQPGGGGDDGQQTSDGGYIIVVGSTYSDNTDKTSAWLVKTDSDGNHIWYKTLEDGILAFE